MTKDGLGSHRSGFHLPDVQVVAAAEIVQDGSDDAGHGYSGRAILRSLVVQSPSSTNVDLELAHPDDFLGILRVHNASDLAPFMDAGFNGFACAELVRGHTDERVQGLSPHNLESRVTRAPGHTGEPTVSYTHLTLPTICSV